MSKRNVLWDYSNFFCMIRHMFRSTPVATLKLIFLLYMHATYSVLLSAMSNMDPPDVICMSLATGRLKASSWPWRM